MARYLVDTTILIGHLRGDAMATQWLKRDDGLISVVGVVELMQGARNMRELTKLETLVDQLQVEWGSGKVNQRAVELMSRYYLKYNLRFMDALVVATALENNLVLVSDNIKHFQFIEGLKVIGRGDGGIKDQ